MRALGLFTTFILLTTVAQAKAKTLLPSRVQIERVGDMVHFEFMGQDHWEYDLKKEGKVLEITVPKIQESDIQNMLTHKDLLVHHIEITNENPNKTTLNVHLTDSGVESFDYLTQDPSHLVVDLFVSEDKLVQKLKDLHTKRLKEGDAPVVAKAKPKKKTKRSIASSSKTKAQKKADRRPAFAEFLFTSEDKNAPVPPAPEDDLGLGAPAHLNGLFDFSQVKYESDNSLEAKVIEAQGNIYLRFPIKILPNRHIAQLEKYKPKYKIKPSFSDENKQARFLLHLLNTKAYASFIKTKRIFRKAFPTSKYDEIIDYAEADVWLALWKKNGKKELFNKSIGIYKKMIQRYPYSKITERTLIYIAMLAHKEKRYFLATKLLKRYLAKYPESPFIVSARIYLADTLAHMNNFSGAIEEFNTVRKSNQKEAVVEADFRKGDVYFLQQDYRRAQKQYTRAISKYPSEAKNFPNAWFNLAESEFNLADYPESLNAYKKFYSFFPRDPYSGFALTRIGELVDILNGNRHLAQGFYNESFFRFRNETGGYIARIRSLSQRFKGMSEKELKNTIEEIKTRAKRIDIPQVDEFTAFMISDGYYWRGDFMKAADTLISYFQDSPKPVHILKFEKRISRSIAGEVKGLIANEEIVPALSVVESHQKSWLSKVRRVDIQYFRALSLEKLGLTADANQSYKRLLKRMIQLVDSKEETERKVFEYYPSFSTVLLRLAVTGYKSGKSDNAAAYLARIKSVDNLKPEEKHDYYVTKSKIAFDKKDYEQAMKLADSVRDVPIPDKEKRDKYFVYLSNVYEKNQRYGDAIDILEKYYDDSLKRGDNDQIYVLSRLFHLYKEKGMADKAIDTGEKLLSKYGSENDLDKERYYLGELLYQQKKVDKAKLVWKELEKKGLWSELAANKIASQDWKQQTEESMNRIPAMAK